MRQDSKNACTVGAQHAAASTTYRDRRSSLNPTPTPPRIQGGAFKAADVRFLTPSPNSEREPEGEVSDKRAHHAILYQYQHAAPLHTRQTNKV